MRHSQIMREVTRELGRSKLFRQDWPKSIYSANDIVIRHKYRMTDAISRHMSNGKPMGHVIEEAVNTIVTTIQFLENLGNYDKPERFESLAENT